MNYSQFLLMMPEATLVAILIIVFFADLLMKGEQKVKSLGVLTSLLWRGRMQRYFPGTAVCLFALVLLTFLSDMFLCDTWGELFSSRYDISYFNMSLPFAVAALAVRDDVSGC